jgi:O-succinylhomoserine sulfhydrylase
MQELVDVEAVCQLAHGAGAKVVVDNVFGTPIFSKPLEQGADVIVYSATKHIDGQGRTLGGAILGTSDFINGPVKNLMRHIGPSMSPFNAWVLVKGLETLSLRVKRMSASAFELAHVLEAHPKVSRVLFPWLESHPQHDLAAKQMYGGGTVVTFELVGGKEEAFAVMNALEIVDISNNLGDAKSMITHPATTTHRRLGAEARLKVGITDGVLRVSVGLEDVRDLIEDFEQALA